MIRSTRSDLSNFSDFFLSGQGLRKFVNSLATTFRFFYRFLIIPAICLGALTGCASLFSGDTSDEEGAGSKFQRRADQKALALNPSDFILDGNFVLIEAPVAEPLDISDKAKEGYRRALVLMRKKQFSNAQAYLKPLVIDYPELSGPYVNLAIARKDTFVEAQLKESVSRKANKNQKKVKKVDSSQAEKGSASSDIQSVNNSAKDAKDGDKAALLTPEYLAQEGNPRMLLNAAINANPLNFDAYLVLANIERKLGHFDEAKSALERGLAQWPHHSRMLDNYGILNDLYLNDPLSAYRAYDLARRIYLAKQLQQSLEPDKKIVKQYKGWLVDLERRIPEQQKSELEAYKQSIVKAATPSTAVSDAKAVDKPEPALESQVEQDAPSKKEAEKGNEDNE